MKPWLVSLFLARAAWSLLAADTDVIPHRQDKPPNKPYSPQEALAKMSVPDGFSVELVASEPEIVNPIAMAFDDRGRIWITESIEYPRKPAGPGKDRVKILEDTGGYGRADRVKVFADGFNIPTGVAVGYGGVWVLNSPDLLFLTEKDGKETSRQVIVTGFGRSDMHELPNSLTWGPDGWLYGLNGVFNPSRIRSNNGKEYNFTCAMWRIHPRTHEFQVVCEGTSNPYGIAWDKNGSAIVEACHWANDHLFHFVETGYYQRQAGAYPPFAMKIGSITDHGHQKTAYCGIAYFDSDAYPEKFRERIYVGNIHGGCINVDRLERDGSTYLGKGEPDFLSANDVWFMPVAQKVGPDGCLYILDWYDRYHCYQDANRDPGGIDRINGRLYRVRYKNTPRAPRFDLASESDEQLLERLSSPNVFFREAAQRLLTERLNRTNEPSNNSALGPSPTEPDEPSNFERRLSQILFRGRLADFVLNNSAPRQARLHAFWVLIGSGQLDPSFYEKLFANSDPTFRAWAVRAAGDFGNGINRGVSEKISSLTADPSPDVQLQVVIASRKIKGMDALPVLVDALAHCGQDKLIPSIVWQNMHPLLEDQSARFVELVKAKWSGTGKLPDLTAIATLAPLVVDRVLCARKPNAAAVASLIEFISGRDPERAKECFSMIASKFSELDDSVQAALKNDLQKHVLTILEKRNSPLYLSAQLLAARLKITPVDSMLARRSFADTNQTEDIRLQALDALIAFRDSTLLQSLPELISSSSTRFTTRVFAALGRFDDPKLADILLKHYPKLAPELQTLAINLIMQREFWARKLLDAVLAKKLPTGVLNANHLRKIMESNDREAIWAVEKAWGQVREERNPDREKVVAEMGQYIRENIGDPRAGRQVFKNFCAQCHTIFGEGGNVGPDLTSNGRASFDQLLSNVFDPSLVIGPAYQVVTVVTIDGRNLTGLISEDNDLRIVLKLPGEGMETIPRGQVKYTRVSKLSMMPEGIETLLSRADLADLFAFLALDRPPTDPQAHLIPGAPTELAARLQAVPVKASTDSNSTPKDRTQTSGKLDSKLRIEREPSKLRILFRKSATDEWTELMTYVTDPALRPYLHPVRDPFGRVVLTENRPDDHPWQHGIFTGFHRVNGFNYWKEDEGHQHFVRLLGVNEMGDKVSWRSLTELIAPNGRAVLDEVQSIAVHSPIFSTPDAKEKSASHDFYMIDFDFLLRAKDIDVAFGKFGVGGLAVRMPWEKSNPKQMHLNSNGLHGRDCEQKRAKWCNVERPFGPEIYGVAVFDHPTNPNHPSGWRVDEQGLINPVVSMLGDWILPAKSERVFRQRIVVYSKSASAEWLEQQFNSYAEESLPIPAKSASSESP